MNHPFPIIVSFLLKAGDLQAEAPEFGDTLDFSG
jgi:hypothetical protein